MSLNADDMRINVLAAVVTPNVFTDILANKMNLSRTNFTRPKVGELARLRNDHPFAMREVRQPLQNSTRLTHKFFSESIVLKPSARRKKAENAPAFAIAIASSIAGLILKVPTHSQD